MAWTYVHSQRIPRAQIEEVLGRLFDVNLAVPPLIRSHARSHRRRRACRVCKGAERALLGVREALKGDW